MKALLAKLLLTLGLLGTTLGAPIIPSGNGLISYAVFKDHGTGKLVYQEISDNQYADMGKIGGVKQNPTATSSDGVLVPMLRAVQYPTKDQSAILTSYKASATSTQEIPPLDSFTDTDNVSLYQYLAPKLIAKAQAAIAFDATSNTDTTGTSVTFSHTMSASAGRYLTCGIAPGNDVNDITGVTYNAVAMTQYELVNSTGGSHQYGFGLANPSSGANNVVVSRTTSGEVRAVCDSYIGALGGLDNHGQNIQSGTQTSLTTTATSIADNSWALLFFGFQRTPSVSTGLTNRGQTGDSAYHGGDSNGVIHPAGNHDMTYTFASCGDQCMSAIWFTLSPTAVIVPSLPQDLIMSEDE